MTHCRCVYGCDHERHKPYHIKFTNVAFDWCERQYYWDIGKYIMDPNISPLDPDDLEVFQDIVFESPWGRIHIDFYERLFKNYYKFNEDWVLKVFSKYLLFLDAISPLFLQDALYYVFRQGDIATIEKLLKELSFDMKMKFIKASEKYPDIIKAVPKLKLYNLFS